MGRPFIKGGKALTLTATLLCTAAFLESLVVSETMARAETQAEAQAFMPGVVGRITSCRISGDKQDVEIGFSNTGNVTGTDGNIYIFEMRPYEEELRSRSSFIASPPALSAALVSAPLSLDTPQGRLYSRFVLAIFDRAEFTRVSRPHYITNPELIAKNQTSLDDPLTKKGLVIEIDMLNSAFDLGVKHVTTNTAFLQIMGTGIDYQYDGETYHFDKGVMDTYDKTISALSNKGMMITIILLNDWNPSTSDLVYPGTQENPNAFYYIFNMETKAGFNQIKAIASFLAQHHSSGNPNYDKMSNWIIGSGTNSQQWSYMGAMDLASYAKAYQRISRAIHTAIKSTSANNRVYFSLDYNWMNEINGRLKYGGKKIVDNFNSIINTQGQMNWDLAYHPYPCPITEPELWGGPQFTGLFTDDFSSPAINFANLSTLTDYFVQGTLKAPGGNVRHIILTKQGFTPYSPTRSDISETRTAAYAYLYHLVNNNPYIDAYTVSHQVDAPSETKGGLRFGPWEYNMNQPNLIVAAKRKKVWRVFWNIDKKNTTLEATEFAESITDIDKWSDVVPSFKWKSLER